MSQRRRSDIVSGFSILELLAAMLIMSLVTGAVVTLLHQTRTQAAAIDYRMTQLGMIQAGLDMFFEDLTNTTYAGGEVEISYALIGWQETSHVKLTVMTGIKAARRLRTIDWLAAPGEEGPELILYRRERNNEDQAKYIPLCSNIHSFKVDMLDRKGELLEDPNLAASMFEVQVEIYRDQTYDPERVLKVMRIFCPKRFD